MSAPQSNPAPAFTPGEYVILADVGEGWFFESARRLDEPFDADWHRERIDTASGGDARVMLVPVAQAAAAPEMYAALEGMVEFAKAAMGDLYDANELVADAIAALARARGEVQS